MTDGLPGTRSRVPTAPQPPVAMSITLQTDELERLLARASEQGAVRGVQAANLTQTATSGLDQSKTIMTLTGEIRRARKIIGLLIGIASSVGAIAGTCATQYQDRKVEVLEPIAAIEQKAVRAEKKVKEVELTTEERLDAADERVRVVEEALDEVRQALKANTDAVLGIAAKLDAPPTPAKKRP